MALLKEFIPSLYLFLNYNQNSLVSCSSLSHNTQMLALIPATFLHNYLDSQAIAIRFDIIDFDSQPNSSQHLAISSSFLIIKAHSFVAQITCRLDTIMILQFSSYLVNPSKLLVFLGDDHSELPYHHIGLSYLIGSSLSTCHFSFGGNLRRPSLSLSFLSHRLQSVRELSMTKPLGDPSFPLTPLSTYSLSLVCLKMI